MAYRVLRIPINARPQIFTIMLSGVLYTIRLYWLVPAECWVIDIMDSIRNPLVCGIPLITGTDLIGQFEYVGIPGQLLVVSDQLPPETVPDFTHLGITGKVYYIIPEEVVA